MPKSLLDFHEVTKRRCLVCELPKKTQDEIWAAWDQGVRAADVVNWLKNELKVDGAENITQAAVRLHIEHSRRRNGKG